MINSGMFTSNKQDWETPQRFFNQLDKEFNFNLDAAAQKHNAKCGRYLDNAIEQTWSGRVFCNPPYGKALRFFVEKAYKERDNCEVIVLLIPARTDTRYFHDYIYGKAEIRFLKGRLKFEVNGKAMGPAPFPSMLVIYKNNKGVKVA